MGRHFKPVASELRSVTNEISEAGVVVAVIRASDHVLRKEQFHSRLEAVEALRSGVDQSRQPADIRRGHQIGKVHPKTGGFCFKAMIEEPSFQTTFDALRCLRIEDLFAFEELADAEVDRCRLEGIAIVDVKTK